MNRLDVWKTYFGADTKHKCYAGCGRILDICDSWHVGHIFARANGGLYSIENLRPVCAACNLDMNTEHMFEYMWRHGRSPSNVVVPDSYSEYIRCKSKPYIKTYEPRRIRTEVMKNTSVLPVVGIINAATGVGKSAMTIEAVGRHLGGKVLLWITEFVNVLETCFTSENIDSWKVAGFIPLNTVVYKHYEFASAPAFQATSIVVCTMSMALNHYPRLFGLDNFLGIVFDEVHHISGDQTRKMILEIIEKTRIREHGILIGMSATPPRRDKHFNIFGNRYLLDYSIVEAWNDNVIRHIELRFCQAVKSGTGDIHDGSLFKSIVNKDILFKNLLKVIFDSETRKGILWCIETRDADSWYDYLHEELESYGIKCVIDHSRFASGEMTIARNAFFKARRDMLMITAHKYREGVDIAHLSFAGVISQSCSDIRAFIQRIGRIMRKTATEFKPAIFCEFLVVGDSIAYAREVSERIIEAYHGIRYKGDCYTYSSNAKCLFDGNTIILRARDKINKIIIETSLRIELMDDMQIIELFKRDGKTITALNHSLGGEITWDYIKVYLAEHGITDSHAGEKHFDSLLLSETPETEPLRRWWSFVRLLYVDWNDLLNIPTNHYYTLEKAKIVVQKIITELTRELSFSDIRLLDDYEIYKKYIVVKDACLPIDPVSYYSKNDSKFKFVDLCCVMKKRFTRIEI